MMISFIVITVAIMVSMTGHSARHSGAVFFWSILVAPMLTTLIFLAIQLVLLAVTNVVGYFLQFILIIAGIPALLAFYLKLFQDSHTFLKAWRAVRSGGH